MFTCSQFYTFLRTHISFWSLETSKDNNTAFRLSARSFKNRACNRKHYQGLKCGGGGWLHRPMFGLHRLNFVVELKLLLRDRAYLVEERYCLFFQTWTTLGLSTTEENAQPCTSMHDLHRKWLTMRSRYLFLHYGTFATSDNCLLCLGSNFLLWMAEKDFCYQYLWGRSEQLLEAHELYHIWFLVNHTSRKSFSK